MTAVQNELVVSADSSPCALELLGIKKSYGSVKVLHGLDLRVRKGSIHALLGANGAGKSTLLKVAVGAEAASEGRVLVNGRERHFSGPLDARKAGIGMVFQERSLVPDLSTVDNIFLNSEIKRGGLVDNRAQRREVERLFDLLKVRIPPAKKSGQLGVADQQMVEIAKALRLASSAMILDEPTAALTEKEVQRLFAVVREIAQTGVGIVYVSHRLGEVFELCDEVTIVRDGRVILSSPVADTSMKQVVEAIAGGAVEEGRIAPAKQTHGADGGGADVPVLSVSNLRVDGKLRDVSFDLRPGEIVGVAGLAGSGRSTMLKSLFGLIRGGGGVRVGGKSVHLNSPAKAIASGVYLIPENRKTQGLVLTHSVTDNLILSVLNRLRIGPLLSRRRCRELAEQDVKTFRINPPDPTKIVERLSGGNQQKVVLGKAFNARGRVLLLDEPTFGVDVHSRVEIRARVREFVDAGNAALWVTSDLQELVDVADRILVLADGTIRDVVSNWPQLTEAEVTHLIQRKTNEPAV